MRFKTARLLATSAALALLAGCGNGGQKADGNVIDAPAPRELTADEGPSGAMTYWGKKIEVVCPGSFTIPARAANAPADDIRGLRIGVTGETAIRFAQCKDGTPLDSVYTEEDAQFRRNTGGLKIRTMATVATGAFPPRWRGNGANVLDMNPSDRLVRTDATWRFIMDGMPGREKLYAMWLEQPFPKNAMPTVASQWAALKGKYGEPNYTDDRGRAYWLHTPDGQPIPAFNRDLLRTCSYQISASTQALQWGPDCGLIVTAEVQPDQNPLIARIAYVAVFNPAALSDYQTNHFEAERDAALGNQAQAQSSNAKGGDF